MTNCPTSVKCWRLEQERMTTLREAGFATEPSEGKPGKPALADFFLLPDDEYVC